MEEPCFVAKALPRSWCPSFANRKEAATCQMCSNPFSTLYALRRFPWRWRADKNEKKEGKKKKSHQVLFSVLSFQVDPSKISPSENLAENQKKLLGIAKSLLNQLNKSIDECSPGMRALFSITQVEVSKKFPDQRTSAVGGFYFLR
jgi:hypothetical protein